MWVVKAEVNPGLATFSLFLMLINKKNKLTHSLLIKTIRKIILPFYASFLILL